MKKKLLIAGSISITLGIVLIVLCMTILKNRGVLEDKIYVNETVMPMAYKVYGNKEVEDGKYYLVKMVFRNNGQGSIKNLRISYRVPGFIEWTTPYRYEEILPGQTLIALFYPKFSKGILDILNATPATVEIKYSYNDGVKNYEMIKRRDFQIRGRDELVYTDTPTEEISSVQDLYTNINVLACFVTPEDPVIKYFTQQLQKNILKGTIAGAGGGEEEVFRFMRAFYEFEKAAGIVYGGTLGLPEKIGGTVTMVQRIRLPREVLTGGAGLCIELSTLFASVAASAGLDPVIFVVSNHAFPGVIVNGNIIGIEATGIGGKGIGGSLPFEKAVKIGTENAQKVLNGMPVNGAPPIGMLRINQLHSQGYRPPDLQDNPSLRKKIDKIFNNMATAPTRQGDEANMMAEGAGTNRAGSIPATLRIYRDPNGFFSFQYPKNWQLLSSPLPFFPNLKLIVADPTESYEAEFYTFPNLYSIEQAMQILINHVRSMGEQINFQPMGSVSIHGKNYNRYVGTTVGNGMQLNWVSYFTKTSQGVVGFVLGSYVGSDLRKQELSIIKNSFKAVR